MTEALRLARLALKRGELPIAAVVVLNDQIIASAYTSGAAWEWARTLAALET